MKLERIQTVQRLPIQLEEAWDFFTSPKNLRLITPHWLDFQLNLDPPEYMHPGTIISASIRPFPVISTNWVSEITHIRPLDFYITEQRFGPFKMWHHEHHFKAIDDGVEIEDIIMYGMHFGQIGSLFHNMFIRKKLHDAFSFRAQALEQRFGSLKAQPRRQERQMPPVPEVFQKRQNQPEQKPQQQKPLQQNPLQQNPLQQNPLQQRPRKQNPLQQNPLQQNPANESPQQKGDQQRKLHPSLQQPSHRGVPKRRPQNPAPQNQNLQNQKPQDQKSKGSDGKPVPKQVTLDDIFHGTDD